MLEAGVPAVHWIEDVTQVPVLVAPSSKLILTLRRLMSYIYMELLVKPEMLTSHIYGAPSKARNANVYIWTYVWQR